MRHRGAVRRAGLSDVLITGDDHKSRGHSLHHDNRLVVLRYGSSTEFAHRLDELRAERFCRPRIKSAGESYEPVTTQFFAILVRCLGNAVGVQHHQVASERFRDLSVVRDVGKQSKWRAHFASAPHGLRSFQPHPFIPFRSIPEWRWVANIRQDKQTPAGVETDGNHGGIVRAAEFRSNRLIEIPHQTRLFQCGEMLLHQRSKLRAHRADHVSMVTHILKRDTRHDAALANGQIVHVAAGLPSPTGMECTHA